MDRPVPKEMLLVPIIISAAMLWIFWMLRRPSDDSQFSTREADRPKGPRPHDADLASAKMKRNEPLKLSGIRIDAPPHQILGVSPQATSDEIQKAYRELMKRYHPDRIGPQGSREWKDAQRIADAINQARETLLKNRPRR